MTARDAAETAAALRRWARGYLPAMGAVEFLIATGMANRIDPLTQDLLTRPGVALGWPDGWEDRFGYLSGGEMATLRLAHAIHRGVIGDEYTRLDGHRRAAFRAALEEMDK